MPNSRGALLCALATTALALLWQAATVTCNYGGDWSAVFHTGTSTRVPPALEAEQVRRVDDAGYDGQYYHFVAHDPLLRRGFAAYVDNPRMRWRRILVPAPAALAGDDFTDSLYCASLLLWVFLGAWWLSGWSQNCGHSPWLGMAFLLAPATLVSLDRGTVDIALAALTVGYAATAGPWQYVVLALAPLARETGLVLVAAHALRRDVRALFMLLPFGAWSAYVASRTAPDLTSHLTLVPFSGLLHRALHPVTYATTGDWLRRAAALDYLAFLGVCACFALLVRRRFGPLEAAATLFCAALAMVGHPQVWAEAYALGRVASPVVILLALIALRDRRWWNLAPLAMILPRLLWQLGPQAGGVWRALVR